MNMIKTLLGFVGTLGGFIGAARFAIEMAQETRFLMDKYGGNQIPIGEAAQIVLRLGPFFVICVLIAAFSLRSLQRRE